MEIQPQHDYLVVRERKPVRSTTLVVPDLVDDGLVKEMLEGEVVAVGPGRKSAADRRDDMWDLQPGQVVKFSPVGSCRLVHNPDLILIRRDAVAGVIHG